MQFFSRAENRGARPSRRIAHPCRFRIGAWPSPCVYGSRYVRAATVRERSCKPLPDGRGSGTVICLRILTEIGNHLRFGSGGSLPDGISSCHFLTVSSRFSLVA